MATALLPLTESTLAPGPWMPTVLVAVKSISEASVMVCWVPSKKFVAPPVVLIAS